MGAAAVSEAEVSGRVPVAAKPGHVHLRLRLFPSLLIFFSAYSPLSIIFLIRDIDFSQMTWSHPLPVLSNPWFVGSFVILCVLSCAALFWAIRHHSTSYPSISVISISDASGNLVEYSFPYLIPLVVADISDWRILFSFGFCMFLVYIIRARTHKIFINPFLLLMGYNFYEVNYKDGNNVIERGICLAKLDSVENGDDCKIVGIAKAISLITKDTPEE